MHWLFGHSISLSSCLKDCIARKGLCCIRDFALGAQGIVNVEEGIASHGRHACSSYVAGFGLYLCQSRAEVLYHPDGQGLGQITMQSWLLHGAERLRPALAPGGDGYRGCPLPMLNILAASCRPCAGISPQLDRLRTCLKRQTMHEVQTACSTITEPVSPGYPLFEQDDTASALWCSHHRHLLAPVCRKGFGAVKVSSGQLNRCS